MVTVNSSNEIGIKLEVNDLNIVFKNEDGKPIVIIDGLTFTARPGELVTLSGRSGSGKSSILRRLVGIDPTDAGTIFWDDTDITTLSDDRRAINRREKYSYVDQESGLIDNLSAIENVLLPIIPLGKHAVQAVEDEALEILSKLGLEKRIKYKTSELSGGEKQRVAVARAILSKTGALVIDEPTASLDRVWADLVIDELTVLASKGHTIIVASHDPNFHKAADQIILLE